MALVASFMNFHSHHKFRRELDAKFSNAAIRLRLVAATIVPCGCGCKDKICNPLGEELPNVDLVIDCRKDMVKMHRQEKCQYLLTKMWQLARKKHSSGILKFEYTLLIGDQLERVCSTTFRHFYDMSHSLWKQLVEHVKCGHTSYSKAFNDSTPISSKTAKNVDEIFCDMRDTGYLTIDEYYKANRMFAFARLPNTDRSLKLAASMKMYFDLVGDFIPNSNGEIHLEQQTKKDIYANYIREYTASGQPLEDLASYDMFLLVWKTAFSHVKIREYKLVTGKCSCCVNLTLARKERLDTHGRALATELHALHRFTYMAERMAYYHRQQQARTYPNSYGSYIMDGMQQSHSTIPYLKNYKDFSNPIKQHLQGVIDHGNGEFAVYRTYENVKAGSNASIHILLMQLEHTISKKGKLPSTVCIQIDGGSENTNQYVLAVCELLIFKRLCNKIVLTRLPVGHTHEDIDAQFGRIWTAARNEWLMTPQVSRHLQCLFCTHHLKQYKKMLEGAVKGCRVVDLFVVGDYKSYFAGCIDPELKLLVDNETIFAVTNYFFSWTKGANTQLQWTFERVDDPILFPLGVKTHYRAYASEMVFEIVKDIYKDGIGYAPVKVTVATFPENGMKVLLRLPQSNLKPEPFVVNSRETLLKCVQRFEAEYRDAVQHCNDWRTFAEAAPGTDSVETYIEKEPFIVPLSESLFGAQSHPWEQGTDVPINSENTFNGREIPIFCSTASVAHSGAPANQRPNSREPVGRGGAIANFDMVATASNEESVSHVAKRIRTDKHYCSCPGTCDTNHCDCKKASRKCGELCHKKSTTCCNRH